MSCGISVIKYILFLVNIICAIAGIALIALGAVVLTQAKNLDGANMVSFNVLAGIIIGLGCIIFIIAFFGCCGAIRESHCMTMTYAVFLLFLLILEIALIAYVFVANIKGGEIFDGLWNNRNDPKSQEVIDYIQSTLQCCGNYGPGDYILYILPRSCCPISEDIKYCTYASEQIYMQGCFLRFDELIQFGLSLGMKVVCVLVTVTGLLLFPAWELQHRFGKRKYQHIKNIEQY